MTKIFWFLVALIVTYILGLLMGRAIEGIVE